MRILTRWLFRISQCEYLYNIQNIEWLKHLRLLCYKQKALKRLQAILETMKKDTEAKQVNQAWREHNKIIRGNPVRIYEGKEFRLVNSKG